MVIILPRLSKNEVGDTITSGYFQTRRIMNSIKCGCSSLIPRITTACTGDLHCVQLAALRAPVLARNAGAVIRLYYLGRRNIINQDGVYGVD